MHLYLHGIGAEESLVHIDDGLRAHPGVYFDMADLGVEVERPT